MMKKDVLTIDYEQPIPNKTFTTDWGWITSHLGHGERAYRTPTV